MKILGITGAIASGKNFITELLQEKFSAKVFDADETTHQLMLNDRPTIDALKLHFPASYIKKISPSSPFSIKSILSNQASTGYIDRKILATEVANDLSKILKLEKIIHPKIHEKYQEFLNEAKSNNSSLAILNIPLLLESKAYKCDAILAIIAKKETRKLRFIIRNLTKKGYIAKRDIGDKANKIMSLQSKIYEELFTTINSWLKLPNNSKIDKKFIGNAEESKTKEIDRAKEKCDMVSSLNKLFSFHENKTNEQSFYDLVSELEARFEFFNHKQVSDLERITRSDFVLFNEEEN